MSDYLKARAVAHVPAALYSRLAPLSTAPLSEEKLEWLSRYRTLIDSASSEIAADETLPSTTKTSRLELLRLVRAAVQEAHEDHKFTPNEFRTLTRKVRPHVEAALQFAAGSQIRQFDDRMRSWQQEQPALDWGRAVVVVLGNHQARRDYLQTQFFYSIFPDSPVKEDRVVFAESTTTPPSLRTEEADDALLLLSKVMFDKGLAEAVFGDRYALQRDVLGSAAKEQLKPSRRTRTSFTSLP